jgi:signal peptidase I
MTARPLSEDSLSEGTTSHSSTPYTRFGEFFRTLALIIFSAVVLRTTLIEAFKIPSGSMIPTLRIGDQLFVWKSAYGLRLPFKQKMIWNYATPKRGDIVVFTREDDPNTQDDESYPNIIKRVIGLPGDTVEVKGVKVYINNEQLSEPYARWEDGGSLEGNFGPVNVPAGHVFLLGDNRDRSKDSRFWNGTHFLPIPNIVGKALAIYWSTDSLKRIGTIIR